MPSRVRDSIPERVAPTLRDGTESEISHTFPVLAMCRRDSRVDREPEEPAGSRTPAESALGCVIRFQNALSPLRDGSESEISHAFPVPTRNEEVPKGALTETRALKPFCALSPCSPLSRVPLFSPTVTKEELQKLLPGCSTIAV